MNAVDTNVLVYSCDVDEPVKQAKALDLLSRLLGASQTLLVWQVACEFLDVLRRWESAGRISSIVAEAAFQHIRQSFALQIPTPAVFSISSHLRSRHSLSHWDSLLLAAAKEAGVNTLYSEDLGNGVDYDGVKVVNPFL